MSRPHAIILPALLMGWLGAGCGDRGAARPPAAASDDAAPVAAPVQAPASLPTDRWVGQWDGPEGTSLVIGGRDGVYELVITNLDGARRFPARADGERIVFTRDGTGESLRPTNGLDTGMKWLSEKTQCLTIRAGEGYCRD